MKSFLKFILIMAGIFLLSAVLAPWFHTFLPFKFERIFNRLVMIFSFAAIFIFVRFHRELLRDYGLSWPNKQNLSYFFTAFFVGVLVLVLLAVIQLILGYSIWSSGWMMSFKEWCLALGTALGAGLLIGIIEEFFFRGFILQSLWKKCSLPLVVSILVTNVFYSLVHFLHGKKPFVGPDPTVVDSFRLMAAPFSTFGNWQSLWPAALGLFIFGLILTDIVLRTRSLYPAMGLHAGCVFFIKMDGFFFTYPQRTIFLGSSLMYDGVLGWIFLGVIWLILRKVIPINIAPQVAKQG